MIEPHADRPQAITLGADKAYDAEDFINELRSMKVTPHVAQNTSGRSSAIDGRTTRHAGYAVSQRIRKRIEEAFGWIKMVAGLEQTKFRGCGQSCNSLSNACQRAAESPHFGACNFPHLAGTAISRLSDQDLRFLAVDRDA